MGVGEDLFALSLRNHKTRDEHLFEENICWALSLVLSLSVKTKFGLITRHFDQESQTFRKQIQKVAFFGRSKRLQNFPLILNQIAVGDVVINFSRYNQIKNESQK